MYFPDTDTERHNVIPLRIPEPVRDFVHNEIVTITQGRFHRGTGNTRTLSNKCNHKICQTKNNTVYIPASQERSLKIFFLTVLITFFLSLFILTAFFLPLFLLIVFRKFQRDPSKLPLRKSSISRIAVLFVSSSFPSQDNVCFLQFSQALIGVFTDLYAIFSSRTPGYFSVRKVIISIASSSVLKSHP